MREAERNETNVAILADVFDRLVDAKQLDPNEQSLYLFLVRESRLRGSEQVRISMKNLGDRLRTTRSALEPRIRLLAQKGCIRVVDSGWSGSLFQVLLPLEILGPLCEQTGHVSVDLDAIDFFSDRRFRDAILMREGSRCFYCFRSLTPENWSLDHAEPQVSGGGNTYRNIVAACHSCNSAKNNMPAEDFLRNLYRHGRLSDSELDDRLAAIKALANGELRPDVSAVISDAG